MRSHFLTHTGVSGPHRQVTYYGLFPVRSLGCFTDLCLIHAMARARDRHLLFLLKLLVHAMSDRNVDCVLQPQLFEWTSFHIGRVYLFVPSARVIFKCSVLHGRTQKWVWELLALRLATCRTQVMRFVYAAAELLLVHGV